MSDINRFVLLATSMTNSTLPIAVAVDADSLQSVVASANAKEFEWLSFSFLVDFSQKKTYRVFLQPDNTYMVVDNAFESFGPVFDKPFKAMDLSEEQLG